MARHWAPLQDPTRRETRSRSIIRPLQGVGTSQWEQRPLFSEPGPNQPPPEDGRMASEVQPDMIHPSDGRESSDEVATSVLDEVTSAAIILNFATDNVALPPTDAQITAAFGSRPVGFVGFIIDNGGSGTVILCVRSQQDTWWLEQFTKAL